MFLLKPALWPSKALRMMGAHELLRDDADLLRERDTAHRARVHDDRRGHSRPLPPAARRGDVLPHGNRRARLEHPAGGGGGRARADRVRRPQRRGLQGDDGAGQRVERFLRPDDGRAARCPGPGVPPADLRAWRHLRGRLRRSLLHSLRGLLHGGGARGRTLPSARHPARTGRGEELLLPSLHLSGRPPQDLRRAAGHRASELPLQRGEASSNADWTTSA